MDDPKSTPRVDDAHRIGNYLRHKGQKRRKAMMRTADDTETPTTRRRARLTAWSGIAGALFLGAAVYLVLSLSPAGTGPDAAQTISDFYAEGGNRSGLVVAEPLSIVGGFLLLWFLSQLTGNVHVDQGGSRRHSNPALAGGVTFIVLAFASVTAHTTVAGSAAFFSAFEADPHTAMLFSHLGYVLLAGSMVGAAVLLAATGRRLRGAAGGPRWLGTTAYVLFPISLLSFFFVYLPLMLFLIWILLVSVSTLRKNQIPA
jgi:hypothetical protein